uniref:Fucosyltransferase n=1 Tax=Meloidogyne enterolobii TaxID=390850 RepID=A0A6V7X5G1_MELEN|nr:unnamed protein product [Meloidogyne enterolobii]
MMSIPMKWPPPLILIWTTFYGENFLKYWLINNYSSQCLYKCRYSDDKTLENDASVLFFHIRDKIDPLPSHRSPHQLYTFFVLESPVNTWHRGRYLEPNFFNITMTYRSDSDVIVPYDMFESYTFEDLGDCKVSLDDIWLEDEIDSKINKKEKLTLQFVSNCNTNSKREKYIEELKKYTEITQMGGCVGKNDCGRECEDKLIDSHFFYLAFENSVCDEYLTEKFWRLKNLIVPVVLSRKVIKNVNIPKDSFIAADDFKSPKELAKFLEDVAADKNRYKSYFNWTKKFKRTKYAKEFWNPNCKLCTSLQPFCDLCKLAHTNKKELRINNIYAFWDGGGKCLHGYAENVLLN